jgi:hypothetical protein
VSSSNQASAAFPMPVRRGNAPSSISNEPARSSRVPADILTHGRIPSEPDRHRGVQARAIAPPEKFRRRANPGPLRRVGRRPGGRRAQLAPAMQFLM